MGLLSLAALFFIIAVIAGLFGFTTIAEGSADIAKILFFIFIALFVIVLALGIFIVT